MIFGLRVAIILTTIMTDAQLSDVMAQAQLRSAVGLSAGAEEDIV
jgi:hypothetical protein